MRIPILKTYPPILGLAVGSEPVVEESILALSQTKRNPTIPIIISATWVRGHHPYAGRIHKYAGVSKMMRAKNHGKSITGGATFRKRCRE
jgi:hypothetical protein